MSERRLSDEELAAAEQQLAWRTQGSISVATRNTAMRAIAELRALRLTPADREALEEIRRAVAPRGQGVPGFVSNDALSVLSKLLGQGGEK